MKNSWDKFVLIIVAVAVLAGSGIFVTKALSFKDQFVVEEVAKDGTVEETDIVAVKAANNLVKTEVTWTLPDKGTPPKPLPLFKSITIVEADGKLIDMMSPESEMVRPPVSNKWLIENELNFLNAAVLSKDPDGDGFTNLEEWHSKTGPKDPDAHPAYTGKLYVKERKSKVYKIKFVAKPDAERFQIIREPTAAFQKRENFIMRIGETSEDGQFRIDSYEEKEEMSATGIKQDASIVSITYMPTGEKKDLVKMVSTSIPTYFGELTFDLGTVEPQYIKEGETFTLSTDPKNKYRLLKIEEKSAKISVESEAGEENIVEISTKG